MNRLRGMSRRICGYAPDAAATMRLADDSAMFESFIPPRANYKQISCEALGHVRVTCTMKTLSASSKRKQQHCTRFIHK